MGWRTGERNLETSRKMGKCIGLLDHEAACQCAIAAIFLWNIKLNKASCQQTHIKHQVKLNVQSLAGRTALMAQGAYGQWPLGGNILFDIRKQFIYIFAQRCTLLRSSASFLVTMPPSTSGHTRRRASPQTSVQGAPSAQQACRLGTAY